MIKSLGVPYWRLSGYYFLFFVTVGIYMPFWSLYLRSINFNAEQIGILSAIVVGTHSFSHRCRHQDLHHLFMGLDC